ncbi:hypothetical protein C0992_012412 [Termitomyces sp. T32_za158]|nr:hypothetical protein C0992_012412 [Termitomyces sp. T32_za158]
MAPVTAPKKSSAGGKTPGPEVPSTSGPSAPETAGNAASTAFGEIRNAIPASSIGDAVSHVPGGGLATSAFKVAKGFGGLGIALGSAGAAAISKKRRSQPSASFAVSPTNSTI